MKLYTEEQVRQAIKKSRSIKNKDGDVFDYYFSDDEAIDFLTAIEFPNYKEIHKQAQVVERYHESMSLEESCESVGRFHGFFHGVYYIMEKLQYFDNHKYETK
jgi:hypothetical protein